MKNLSLCIILILSANILNAEAVSQARPPFQYSLEFILKQVLIKVGRPYNPMIPLPDLKLASETNLANFQADLKDQWSPPPEFVTNVYSAAANRIYILDDLEYYRKLGRCIDDSLAHELTHYVQVLYKKYPIEQFDDSMEFEAIDVQTWFREKFCKTP